MGIVNLTNILKNVTKKSIRRKQMEDLKDPN